MKHRFVLRKDQKIKLESLSVLLQSQLNIEKFSVLLKQKKNQG